MRYEHDHGARRDLEPFFGNERLVPRISNVVRRRQRGVHEPIPGALAGTGQLEAERFVRHVQDHVQILVIILGAHRVREDAAGVEIERVQTGVRLERRLLKVLKALAELKDLTLGDLIEGIVLHAFEGKAPFSPETLREIEKLRGIYGLTLSAVDSHKLRERRKATT